jgi:hypothetical protein
MAGLQSAVPTIISEGADLISQNQQPRGSRPVVVQPPPIDEDPRVEDILDTAERREERTELANERRQAQRREDLEAEQARARVRAAANNTAGTGTAEAIREDNREDAERQRAFDDRETEQDLDRIAADRRRNLLDVARDRRRAAIGLQRQLQSR